MFESDGYVEVLNTLWWENVVQLKRSIIDSCMLLHLLLHWIILPRFRQILKQNRNDEKLIPNTNHNQIENFFYFALVNLTEYVSQSLERAGMVKGFFWGLVIFFFIFGVFLLDVVLTSLQRSHFLCKFIVSKKYSAKKKKEK